MINRFTYFLVFICLVNINANANDTTTLKIKYRKSVNLYYQAGKVLPTNDFVKGQNASNQIIDYYQAFSVQYGVETDGSKIWQQNYSYPTWGFGFYTANFFNKTELGTPSALYGFFRAPFYRFNKWSINYDVGFGLTYNWNKYDQIDNPFQYAIGSSKTVFIDVGFGLEFYLGKHFCLLPAFSFTHFSNGATRVPNMGINLFSPRIGLKYIFNERPKFIVKDIPKYNSEWEYIALLTYASKQLAFDTTQVEGNEGYMAETYNIVTFSTGINRQISRKVKFGLGMDFGYDGAWNSYISYKNGVTESRNVENASKFNLGIYGAFELVIHKLSVIAQPGWYVYRSEWNVPDKDLSTGDIPPRRKSEGSYQRLGIKYHIFDNLFAGINIRAYDFGIADYIEWNVGYRIKWR